MSKKRRPSPGSVDGKQRIRYFQHIELTAYFLKSKAIAMQSALYPTGLAILVPCHNCAEYILECLDSILNQNYTSWRLVVSDDASTDGTGNLAAKYKDPRIRVRTAHPRAYLMGNILGGLKMLAPSPTEVVAIIDGDDHLLPGAFTKIMDAHAKGYDLVYTDMHVDGSEKSLGAQLLDGVPPRAQTWCISHLRSFKGYLLKSLRDENFRDATGNYFAAAGDLSLYLPMAEAAGPGKTLFLPQKLYRYRVHDQCNFKVRREEQLTNNALIRSRPSLCPQTTYFDFTETIDHVEKLELRPLGQGIRQKYPSPYTICIRHVIRPEDMDSWRAYHNLWIAPGVYFAPQVLEEA